MKKLSIYLSICMIFMLPDFNYSQTCANVPLAHGHSGEGRCNWYAMARAFKRNTTGTCTANLFHPTSGTLGIDGSYFNIHSPASGEDEIDFAELQAGDIIEFDSNQHYAYINSITNGISCDHKIGPGDPVETGKSISDIKTEQVYSKVTHYYRLKKWYVQVRNDFDDIYENSKVMVNDQEEPSGIILNNLGFEEQVAVGACEHETVWGGYTKDFLKWTRKGFNDAWTVNYNFLTRGPNGSTTNAIAEHVAVFENKSYVRFQNHFTGISENGSMTVDGDYVTNISFDEFFSVSYNQSISALAENYQQFNQITYHFSNWSTGSTSQNLSWIPQGNQNLTANFTGIPNPVEGLHENGATGDPIHLVWTQHPNANCKYRVYRKIKEHGNVPVLLATLNNNVTSYTDGDYSKTSRGLLISYDARAYYTTECTEAEESWYMVYGGILQNKDGKPVPVVNNLPKVFSLHNYPNPFNPETTFHLELAQDVHVKLCVYDLHGRIIKVITDQYYSSGSYRMNWNGKNSFSGKVSSGVYIARMEAGAFVKSIKLLLAR